MVMVTAKKDEDSETRAISADSVCSKPIGVALSRQMTRYAFLTIVMKPFWNKYLYAIYGWQNIFGKI